MDEHTTTDELVACHELLLRLAGRLEDALLWRFRDWLGQGALAVLGRTLPSALLRRAIALAESEHRLLVAALSRHGIQTHQTIALNGVDDVSRSGYTFASTAPDRIMADPVQAVVDATLRDRPDVGEVRQSWRSGGPAGDDGKRVLLVTAGAGWPRLTGELQRVLRVLGDAEPSVEVLPPRVELGEYHEAALTNSAPVSVGAMGRLAA